MKFILLALLLLGSLAPSQAQWKWYNPATGETPAVQGQGWPEELKGTYTRFPQRAKDSLRNAVWSLSRNSAGVTVHFYSNAPQIKVRYQVEGAYEMPHMPATGVSGIDLYAKGAHGEDLWCAGKYSFADTVVYAFNSLSYNTPHNQGYEYRLYLPLYNTVKWLEIGVPENSRFSFLPLRPEKPIVVYGTSIAQGACASRPGMAWTSQVERRLDRPVINLGFSGNGQLEPQVLNLVNEIDARLYILDCIPNVINRPENEIRQLLVEAVKQIRSAHPYTPILVTEHDGYTNSLTNKEQHALYTKANAATKKAVRELQEEGVKNLHLLTYEDIHMDLDAMVDGVHATDYGMNFYANAYEKAIRNILNEPIGIISTTIPVSQRREPDSYEWKKRHQEILVLNRNNAPQALIIGNSIVHHWGGAPYNNVQSGKATWNGRMEPAGFRNLGFGWDRIENALWRVYHDELDGYQAKKIVLMIGTNNLSVNSDEEITTGIGNLVQAIRTRQPQADIHVIGILPRRDMEKRVTRLNKEINKVAKQLGVRYSDAGQKLLTSKKTIDESLFRDGLHPNENGYKKIIDHILN